MNLQIKKKSIDEYTKDSTEHEIAKLKNKPENKRIQRNWSINRTH